MCFAERFEKASGLFGGCFADTYLILICNDIDIETLQLIDELIVGFENAGAVRSN